MWRSRCRIPGLPPRRIPLLGHESQVCHPSLTLSRTLCPALRALTRRIALTCKAASIPFLASQIRKPRHRAAQRLRPHSPQAAEPLGVELSRVGSTAHALPLWDSPQALAKGGGAGGHNDEDTQVGALGPLNFSRAAHAGGRAFKKAHWLKAPWGKGKIQHP